MATEGQSQEHDTFLVDTLLALVALALALLALCIHKHITFETVMRIIESAGR